MFLRTILKNYLILFLLVFSFYTSFSYSDDQKIKTLNQLGSNEAKNTLVEYASLSCVHCANFHNNEFLKIKTNFIDTGKLKFIYKDFPLDRPSMYASLVNHCFSGEQYFEVLSSLYRNQRKWVSVSNNSGKFYGALHDTLKVHGIKLEKVIEDFMERWGPDVQKKRDRRDEVWDEMVRVVSIQDKHKGKQ